ncbi:MAG: hypothetical protein ACLQVD_02615 [Capsulimonadaceae bacterium]
MKSPPLKSTLGLLGWGTAGAVVGVVAMFLLVFRYTEGIESYICASNPLKEAIFELAFVATPIISCFAAVALGIRYQRLDPVSRRRKVWLCLVALAWGIAGAVVGPIAGELIVFSVTMHGVDPNLVYRLPEIDWDLACAASPVLFFLAAVSLRVRHQRLDEVSRRHSVLMYLAGVVLVVVTIFLDVTVIPYHPEGLSDSSMISHFQQHRAVFERLEQMAEHDPDLDYESDEPVDWDNTVGASPGRLAVYRTLLNQIGGDEDISGGSEVDIQYWSCEYGLPYFGSLLTKGYAWCEKPPDGLVTLPLDNPNFDENDHRYYRHIDGKWYLYYYGNYNGM